MKQAYQTLGPKGFGNYEVEFKSMTFRPVAAKADRLLVPGFVDIHIHGAYGIDFMSGTGDDMKQWIRYMEKEGYEGFLPTTVTASPEAVSQAISNLPDDPMILGFHLEGPFISPTYPGAQPKEFIAEPPSTMSDWDPILEDRRLRVVTLAPEVPRALELSARLMQRGVIVSMGHTNATFEEARRGYEFGARHTTHTYNAMRPLHHREAGTVGYALANDDLSCELIYDRLHVCPDAARILIKAKSTDKVIAVSDGTMATGLRSGTALRMWNIDCIVGKGDVRLLDGTLAGSAISLLDAFRNLYKDFGLECAVKATSLNPRKALGMNGPPKVWIELDQKLNIVTIHRVP